jgi:hypothetical protein
VQIEHADKRIDIIDDNAYMYRERKREGERDRENVVAFGISYKCK